MHSCCNVPYSKELVDGLIDTQYDSVGTYLTISMLIKFKDKVYMNEFCTFVQVCADCCIVGNRINFINALNKNKETLLIEGYRKDCNESVKGSLIVEHPRLPILLEPKLFASVMP